MGQSKDEQDEALVDRLALSQGVRTQLQLEAEESEGYLAEHGSSMEKRDALMRWAQLTCAGEVAAMVAHDINNAVTGVISYTELARMDMPEWGEAASYLDKSLQQARRISSLATRMLLLSSQAEAYPAAQNLKESVATACALMARRLEKDHIAFDIQLESLSGSVVADAARLLLTWLEVILIARSALEKTGAAQYKHLAVIADDATPSVNEAQIRIEATGTGLPLLDFAGFQPAPGEPALVERELLLYSAAQAYLAELGGAMSVETSEDHLSFLLRVTTGA